MEEKKVYIVFNASNNMMASKAFRDFKNAQKHWKELVEIACNPYSYYIQQVEII